MLWPLSRYLGCTGPGPGAPLGTVGLLVCSCPAGVVRKTDKSTGRAQGAEGRSGGPDGWAFPDGLGGQVPLPVPPGPAPQGSRVSLSLSLLPHPGCRFGGGPAVNHLYVCSICQVEIETLAKRRRVEIDTFIKVRAGGGSVGKLGLQPLLGTPGDLRTKEPCAIRFCLEDVFCGRSEWPEVWPDF